MSYLLEEELTSQGIATKTTWKIRFNHKVYVRVKTLPIQFYEQGQKLKEKFREQNRDSLLIKHKTWITIWTEKLNRLDEIENSYFYREQDLLLTFENVNGELTDGERISPLNNKDTVVRPEVKLKQFDQKYRGVACSYKIPKPNYREIPQAKNFQRKYRGRSY